LERNDAVTEAEWLGCTDPQEILFFMWDDVSLRKLRLFAAASCRRVWHLLRDPRSRRAVEEAERYADGLATREQMDAAYEGARGAHVALLQEDGPASEVAVACAVERAAMTPHGGEPRLAAWGPARVIVRRGPDGEAAAQVALLHEVFGNPFRPTAFKPAWLTDTVRKLARAIYEQRAFGRLPILADALEEGGCDDVDILAHLRGGGEHALGCWALDLVLGKD
jgi:hypothetical protein